MIQEKLTVGSWKTKQHYGVVGKESDFYVWVRELDEPGSSSSWIKGAVAFRNYNNLKHLFKKNKEKFVEAIIHLHKTYK